MKILLFTFLILFSICAKDCINDKGNQKEEQEYPDTASQNTIIAFYEVDTNLIMVGEVDSVTHSATIYDYNGSEVKEKIIQLKF